MQRLMQKLGTFPDGLRTGDHDTRWDTGSRERNGKWEEKETHICCCQNLRSGYFLSHRAVFLDEEYMLSIVIM